VYSPALTDNIVLTPALFPAPTPQRTMPPVRTVKYHLRTYNRRPGDIPISPAAPRYRVRRKGPELEYSAESWPFPPVREMSSDSEDDEVIPTSDPDEVVMVSCYYQSAMFN
jgi:hypothetical protein